MSEEEHRLRYRIAELKAALFVVKVVLDEADDSVVEQLWMNDETPLSLYVDSVLGAKE